MRKSSLYFAWLLLRYQLLRGKLRPLQQWKYRHNWLRSLEDGYSLIKNKTPWLTYSSIDYLTDYCQSSQKRLRVFEWGMGGSTVFFLHQGCSVTSIESDPQWLLDVCEEISQNSSELKEHWQGYYCYSQHTSRPLSHDLSCHIDNYNRINKIQVGVSSQPYEEVLVNHNGNIYDIVLVDGVEPRAECIKSAVNHVADNGIIILDNAELTKYQRVREWLTDQGWTGTSLWGPGPLNYYFWKTEIWRRQP